MCVILYSHGNAMNNNNHAHNTTPETTKAFLQPYHFQSLEEFSEELRSQKFTSGKINKEFLRIAFPQNTCQDQQTPPSPLLDRYKNIVHNEDNQVYESIRQYQNDSQRRQVFPQSYTPSSVITYDDEENISNLSKSNSDLDADIEEMLNI